jgi:hypothetical protein
VTRSFGENCPTFKVAKTLAEPKNAIISPINPQIEKANRKLNVAILGLLSELQIVAELEKIAQSGHPAYYEHS